MSITSNEKGPSRKPNLELSLYFLALQNWLDNVLNTEEGANKYGKIDIKNIHPEPPTIIDKDTISVCLIDRYAGKIHKDVEINKLTFEAVAEYFKLAFRLPDSNVFYDFLYDGINGDVVINSFDQLSQEVKYYLIGDSDNGFFIFMETSEDGVTPDLKQIMKEALHEFDFQSVELVSYDENDQNFPVVINENSLPADLATGKITIKDDLLKGDITIHFVSLPALKELYNKPVETRFASVTSKEDLIVLTPNAEKEFIINLRQTNKFDFNSGDITDAHITNGKDTYPVDSLGNFSIINENDYERNYEAGFKFNDIVPVVSLFDNEEINDQFEIVFTALGREYKVPLSVKWDFKEQVVFDPYEVIPKDSGSLENCTLKVKATYQYKPVHFKSIEQKHYYTSPFKVISGAKMSTVNFAWLKGQDNQNSAIEISTRFTSYGVTEFTFKNPVFQSAKVSLFKESDKFLIAPLNDLSTYNPKTKQFSLHAKIYQEDSPLFLIHLDLDKVKSLVNIGSEEYKIVDYGYKQDPEGWIDFNVVINVPNSPEYFERVGLIDSYVQLGTNKVETRLSATIQTPPKRDYEYKLKDNSELSKYFEETNQLQAALKLYYGYNDTQSADTALKSAELDLSTITVNDISNNIDQFKWENDVDGHVNLLIIFKAEPDMSGQKATVHGVLDFVTTDGDKVEMDVGHEVTLVNYV